MQVLHTCDLRVAECQHSVGITLYHLGRFAEARTCAENALTTIEALLGADCAAAAESRVLVAAALCKCGASSTIAQTLCA